MCALTQFGCILSLDVCFPFICRADQWIVSCIIEPCALVSTIRVLSFSDSFSDTDSDVATMNESVVNVMHDGGMISVVASLSTSSKPTHEFEFLLMGSVTQHRGIATCMHVIVVASVYVFVGLYML